MEISQTPVSSRTHSPLASTETGGSDAAQVQPLYLEDMNVGDRWMSESREITADDVADFAILTGDNDPLHTEAGASSPFGEPVAHGLLGLSVLAGLSSQKPKVATLALVSIAEWQFEAPIFFGDVVRVCTEIEEIGQHGRRAGRVTWVRSLINQHGRVVQRGRFVSLVSTRARARRLSNIENEAPTDDTSSRGTLPAR
ncbi:Bifunctional protein PaaZ [Rubripirellula amarantea]|uniref:Bifunctional protein PaaZ n=1 Tax=Rubripirellula amarantea TaxID=2527999 RepID=A0A5C5WW23_9BACT|nr:MaoC/PaaZ C-terminal domain-containing protein [Rubripirellula amarantea]TWT54135.1 Bifunctional protein PaaZ [Rubripirellula amarantea]